MSVSKLPNLGSRGWGKSLNDYIEDIGDRISSVEHDLNEAREQEKVFNISSGVVGFGGKMMRIASESDPNPGEYEIGDGQEITPYGNYNQFFWRGDVFFKDTGDGFPLNVYMDENTNFSLEDLEALETGWNPVYLFFDDGVGVTYRVDNVNAYLTHPLVILLGFIFYDGSKKYWYYKTSRSEENTYGKRFMLTKPLAKFNSTFSVGVSGDYYTITGKKVGTANPTLTLNAMGINYENSSISFEELKMGPDYKEFTVDEDTPIIWVTTNSITFGISSSDLEFSNGRLIHRVYFSNIGYYVIQSEKYNGNDDFSSVVSYGFQPMNTNLERYGDLVELFRFVTVGTEGEGDSINVYQAIGSGIPPVDSFGVVPEVNYVSREGSNNIQFTDSNNNYFTLVGQNYVGTVTPKVVRLNFNHSNSNYNYHALMNYTDINTTDGIQFKGASTTVYDFTTNNLSLELSPNRYIKMGTPSGIELKNGNSIISMNNDGLLNIQARPNKRLWMEYTVGTSSGVGLQNDESNIVLADNGNIGLSSQNINLNAASVEIEAPSVDIAATDLDIAATDVDIVSSDMKITSDSILIRANKNSWPEELINSMEYVFDPQAYGEDLLRDLYMGTQHDITPVQGDVAHLLDFDISQAFYKTDEGDWCLGLWGGHTHYVQTPPSTYLVVIKDEDGVYKFDFVKKVEGYTAEEKEDSFVFSVFPHNTSSLTETGGAQGNDAFYQLMSGEVTIESEGKVTIKSETMIDIDSVLTVVGGDLEVAGNILAVSDLQTTGGLQIGFPNNYKLVYLNGVNLECVNSSGELRWKDLNNYYALNNIPFILKGGSLNEYDNVSVTILGNQYFASWTGSFPLRVWGTNLGGSSIVWISPRYGTANDWMALKRNGEEQLLTSMNKDIMNFWIFNFTGWAWEIIN